MDNGGQSEFIWGLRVGKLGHVKTVAQLDRRQGFYDPHTVKMIRAAIPSHVDSDKAEAMVKRAVTVAVRMHEMLTDTFTMHTKKRLEAAAEQIHAMCHSIRAMDEALKLDADNPVLFFLLNDDVTVGELKSFSPTDSVDRVTSLLSAPIIAMRNELLNFLPRSEGALNRITAALRQVDEQKRLQRQDGAGNAKSKRGAAKKEAIHKAVIRLRNLWAAHVGDPAQRGCGFKTFVSLVLKPALPNKPSFDAQIKMALTGYAYPY